MYISEAGTMLLNDMRSKIKKQYNKEFFEKLIQETELLKSEMQKIKDKAQTEEITTETSLNYMLLKKHEERNERIRKTYLYHRYTNKYTDTQNEKDYQQEYEQLYKQYLSTMPFLSFDISEPPIEMFVTILTLRDCGVVMVGDDIIEMKGNMIYHVKKSCVKHLIDSNYAKIIQ